ncbi:MAG: methyl-coenzyme M reductase I operon protein C [Candidatus Helarchaeota archaeon]|nr:methyl-coenzyme M reductase I operon protein C [Candidatus Helarchaeota archaeon]
MTQDRKEGQRRHQPNQDRPPGLYGPGCKRNSFNSKLGRQTQIIDCRETAGLGLGGGLAQRATFSEAAEPDIIILSMGPSPRHITKPVCEITYGLREAGLQVSVLIMRAGIGPTEDMPGGAMPGAGVSGITPEEEDQIARHRMAIIHLGNVPGHFVYKARRFLKNVEIPAIIICQAPVGFEDFAKVGIPTRPTQPQKATTKGYIIDIVTGVIRGQTVPQFQVEEIIEKVKYWLNRL